MRLYRRCITILLLMIAISALCAETNDIFIPDSIRAEDYARFINDRVERIAEYLVDHERKMPNLLHSEHQASVDSLKFVFKTFRSDIEKLPAINGNKSFRNTSINTITEIISLLGDDFPDLHKAARDIITSKGDMEQYNKIHDKITMKLNKARQQYYSEYEKYIIENHFYNPPLLYNDQIDINDIQVTVENFLNAMSSSDPNLVHFFSISRLKEIGANTKDVFSYQNIKYSFIDINPEYSIALVKIVLKDRPASFDIWFKVEEKQNQFYIAPSGLSNNKIIPWLYIRNSQY